MLAIAVLGNLVHQGLRDVLFQGIEHFFLKDLEAAIAHEGHVTILQEVAIEIVENTIDCLRVDDKVRPDIDQLDD